MSIKPIIRKCEHCGYRYTYNPSVGNLGIICPKCCKGQSVLIPEAVESVKKNN